MSPTGKVGESAIRRFGEVNLRRVGELPPGALVRLLLENVGENAFKMVSEIAPRESWSGRPQKSLGGWPLKELVMPLS